MSKSLLLKLIVTDIFRGDRIAWIPVRTMKVYCIFEEVTVDYGIHSVAKF